MDLFKTRWKFYRCSQPTSGVLLVELDRPPVNAFHDDMWQELRTVVHAVPSSDIRCVVLASRLDKGFTAGLDVKAELESFRHYPQDPGHKALNLNQHLADFQDAITSLAECRVPVIVAIHGICIGLGIDMASACDIRLAAEGTTFSIAEVNVGLAADIGTLQRFPKIVGNNSKAREMALTARPFEAKEAKEMGFLSEVVPGGRTEVIKAAVEMAKIIAEKSPVGVMGTKHLMNHARDHTIQDGLEYTRAWNMGMLQAKDFVTAMNATISKKTPQFAPLPSSAPVKSKL